MRGIDDWVHAAEVISFVGRSGVHLAEDRRDLALGLIARLILAGLIVPGDIVGQSHRPWTCSPIESIGRITQEWSAKPDPFVMPGEIVWFDLSPEGKIVGDAVLRRIG
ncbi:MULTISPECIES: hypothetical protein [unclassified Salinibacterium]|uniref:hypothetical protein n=1 Tax=unclassified Salinibacterium TaxID=2632331 RepID=UPI0018CFED31|nr:MULTISPECIES: hypothetical protein [unclassified Salinibacterium]MBH0053740.1 hypothetical protein [Salinibacterium sp. SWN139]MBH0083014.1 hypothetical protein [Salinibacterium sp. SWN167]